MADAKKSKKHGRQKKSGGNLAYIREGRHNKGHLRRITKHLRRYGVRGGAILDRAAVEAMKSYGTKCGRSSAAEGELKNIVAASGAQ